MRQEHMLATVQALLAVLFLFAGIYKGVVPSPIDWTLLTGGFLCLSLLPQWRIGLELLRHPAIWLFAVLIVYLAISGWPLSEWGQYKLAEAAFLGGPALAAGYVLFRTGAERQFQIALLILSIPSAVAIIVMSLMNNSLHYSILFLSGGYQLPGAMLAFAFLAVTLTGLVKGWLRFAVGAILSLGLFSTGSTIGTFSALLICGAVALWSFPLRRLRPGFWLAAIVIPVAFVSMTVKPPPSVTRLLLKYEFLDAQIEAPIDIEGLGQDGQVIVDIEGSMTDVTDRAFLFRAAYQFWLEAPVFGHGFGSLQYAKNYRTPHNVPLELLAEGGAIAFILAATIIGFVGMSALVQRSPAVAYPLAIFMLTLAASMVGGYFVGRLQMFAIGAAIAASPVAAVRATEVVLSALFSHASRDTTPRQEARRSSEASR